MSNGKGCNCGACCRSQCGCDVDWTPQEVYDLRERVARKEFKAEFRSMQEAINCNKRHSFRALPVRLS